ncbi:unnamed protein product [Rhizoctonia solani]|uniref:Uncharacterized protein n=1 Tax=Rhizoctonia solani TaxID=456999 RepID=A0A8H2XZ61_9AGAM|nr:unnamed protein product [Rhizoctonia solani]
MNLPAQVPSHQSGFGGFPMPHELTGRAIKRYFPQTMTLTRTLTMGSGGGEPREVPYITFDAIVGRNSQFHDLSQDEQEELGGVEYRALGALLWIIAAYHLGIQLFGFIVFAPYSSMPRWAPIFREQQHRFVPPTWISAFQAVSAYRNTGMSLIDQSMVPFQTAYPMIMITFFMILASNTAFPIWKPPMKIEADAPPLHLIAPELQDWFPASPFYAPSPYDNPKEILPTGSFPDPFPPWNRLGSVVQPRSNPPRVKACLMLQEKISALPEHCTLEIIVDTCFAENVVPGLHRIAAGAPGTNVLPIGPPGSAMMHAPSSGSCLGIGVTPFSIPSGPGCSTSFPNAEGSRQVSSMSETEGQLQYKAWVVVWAASSGSGASYTEEDLPEKPGAYSILIGAIFHYLTINGPRVSRKDVWENVAKVVEQHNDARRRRDLSKPPEVQANLIKEKRIQTPVLLASVDNPVRL